jgi:hypothetical protein
MKIGGLAVLCILATYPAAAQTAHRELGAHVHGRGTLNIAIEGDKVTMELETPGMDIVGFEHAATTQRDKAALEKAKARLSAPLSLFTLPAGAGCRVTDATIAIERGEHNDDAKEEPEGSTKSEGHAGGHSEFHAQYGLQCSSADTITAIEFDYFRAFPGAEKLDVNVITPKGQSRFEATRARPNISLTGMM